MRLSKIILVFLLLIILTTPTSGVLAIEGPRPQIQGQPAQRETENKDQKPQQPIQQGELRKPEIKPENRPVNNTTIKNAGPQEKKGLASPEGFRPAEGFKPFKEATEGARLPIPLAIIKDRIEASQEAVQQKQEIRREGLKKELAGFKDQNKAQIVNKLDQKISQVNTTVTTNMANHLDKLTSILSTLAERVAQAKIAGHDTTLAEAAITQAQTAIATAQTAVTAQAGKDYGVTQVSESSAKTDVSQVRTTLNADLKSTQESVKLARQAVENALKVAASTLGSTQQ